MHRNLDKALDQVRTPLVAIIEDDDWYAPEYLEDMVDKLIFAERWMIGYDPTVYYHIVKKQYTVLLHPYRASLFTTVGYVNAMLPTLRSILNNPSKPLIDMELWRAGVASSITTVGKLALGIKHNFGACQAGGHTMPHKKHDNNYNYLRDYVGADAENYIQMAKDKQ